jgi:hypothetical protein
MDISKAVREFEMSNEDNNIDIFSLPSHHPVPHGITLAEGTAEESVEMRSGWCGAEQRELEVSRFVVDCKRCVAFVALRVYS